MKAGAGGLQRAVLETTWGSITIRASRRGLWSCDLPRVSNRAAMPEFRVRRIRLPPAARVVLKRAAKYAVFTLEGRSPGGPPAPDPAVLEHAPPFHRAVWRALQAIPRGSLATYAEVAARAGKPRAARAAGSACRLNPLPLFIPCQRVVPASGGLGGFSAGGAWKRRLLTLEGASR